MYFSTLSASAAGNRVSVGELLSGLGSQHRVGALKRRLTGGEGRSQPLKPPLSKPQAERVREGRRRLTGGRDEDISSHH